MLVASGLFLVVTGSAWWAIAPPAGSPEVAVRALPPPPAAVVPGVVFSPSTAPTPTTPAPTSAPIAAPTTAATTGAAASAATSAGSPLAAASVPARGAPVRLDVPALGIDVPVLPVHASGDALEPPSNPFELGWWSDGSEPGQPGATLVTGHTVHNGPGALNSLGRLRPGDLVTVRTRASAITYRVMVVTKYSRAALARASQALFASDGPSRLVLVTCTDWTGRVYLSNEVVTAVPV